MFPFDHYYRCFTLPLLWFITSTLNKFGLLPPGNSRWLPVVNVAAPAGGPNDVAIVVVVVPAASFKFTFESDVCNPLDGAVDSQYVAAAKAKIKLHEKN